MKKQILSIMLLLVSVAAMSKEKDLPVKPVKKLIVKSSFQKLVVNGNVEVILFEDTAKTISITGNEKNAAAVSITEKNGVLTINTRRSLGKPVQLTIPVKGLTAIEAGGSCRISSVNSIETAELSLVINESCRIAVRTTGKVSVVEGKEVEDCYWAIK